MFKISYLITILILFTLNIPSFNCNSEITNYSIITNIISFDNESYLEYSLHPFNRNITHYSITNQTTNGIRGHVIWEHWADTSLSLTSICNNGSYIFLGELLLQPTFKLFNTHGNGAPIWEFVTPSQVSWLQVDSSKNSDVLVGLATSDLQMNERFARLYRWNLSNREPLWSYDIPIGLHVFQGYFWEDNIAVSDDGKTIVISTGNSSQQIKTLLVFNSNSNVPKAIITYPSQFVRTNILEISSDGSLILSSSDTKTVIVNTTTSSVRWTIDENIATFSEDGSVVVYQTSDQGHSLTALNWNSTTNVYDELWRKPVSPPGWSIYVNARNLAISNDGTTILFGLHNDSDFIHKTMVTMLDSSHGTILWCHNTTAGGKYFDTIFDLSISGNGSRAIVGYGGDESNTNHELKVFCRNNSYPIFSFDPPGSVRTVDISLDGKFASASCITKHWFVSEDSDSLEYSINLIDESDDIIPPYLFIVKPLKKLYFNNRELFHLYKNSIIIGPIDIEIITYDGQSGIEKVEFYLDDALKTTEFIEPFIWRWSERAYLKHKITIVAFDGTGNSEICEVVVWKFF